jgi:hypothetical protein
LGLRRLGVVCGCARGKAVSQHAKNLLENVGGTDQSDGILVGAQPSGKQSPTVRRGIRKDRWPGSMIAMETLI